MKRCSYIFLLLLVGQFPLFAAADCIDRTSSIAVTDCIAPPDGSIHLVSSRLHYRFNLAWIKGCGE